MRIVGVDIDGCLADFNSHYIELVKEVTGKDLFPPAPFDIVTWNYPESYGYTAKEISACWNLIKQSNTFWMELPAYPNTGQFLQDLGKAPVEVYFITSRIGKDVKWQSECWLMNSGWWELDCPTVLISSEKGLCCKALKIDLYLDDKVENCQDVRQQSPSTACYMLAQPWNLPVQGVPRLNNLVEFQEIIDGQ